MQHNNFHNVMLWHGRGIGVADSSVLICHKWPAELYNAYTTLGA